MAQQEDSDPFEVILVNNRSTDNLEAAVEPFKDKLDVRIVDALEHAGVSYARNVGIGASTGEYLIFCDGDDVVSPHFIANGQKTLKDYPIYAAGFVPVDTSKFTSVESALEDVEEAPFEAPRADWQDANWPILPGCSFGIRKNVMLELGGFDLTMEPGAEDNDLGIRAAEKGYFPGIMRSAVIAYRVYPAGERSYKGAYARAKSTALLIQVLDRWKNNPVSQRQNPALMIIKVLVSGIKVLLTNHSAINEWCNRYAQAYGIFQGWIDYKILKKTPVRQIGIGLDK